MAKRDLYDEMFAGNKRVQRFTIEDEDAGDGSAKDLTGLTVKWILTNVDKKGTPTATPLLDKASTGPDVSVTDAANGIVEVTIQKADTSGFSAGNYYFEVEVFDGSGDPVVTSTGTLRIFPNVTNA